MAATPSLAAPSPGRKQHILSPNPHLVLSHPFLVHAQLLDEPLAARGLATGAAADRGGGIERRSRHRSLSRSNRRWWSAQLRRSLWSKTNEEGKGRRCRRSSSNQSATINREVEMFMSQPS